MFWAICVFLQIALVICEEPDKETKVFSSIIFPKEGHLDVPETAKRLVFIESNGTLSTDTLAGLKNVDEIVFQRCHFEEIQPGALCAPPNLETLTLNDIHLRELKGDHFKNCANLKTLEIRYHDIPLGPKVFANLENLETLLIAQFKWTELKKGDFSGLKNVKKISITSADLKKIDSGVFEDLKNLNTLRLSNNKISVVKGDEFTGLSSLEDLDINYNPMDSIDIEEVLKNLPNLKKLGLSFALLPEEDQKHVQEKIKGTQVELSLE